jgi:hypothetical protein
MQQTGDEKKNSSLQQFFFLLQATGPLPQTPPSSFDFYFRSVHATFSKHVILGVLFWWKSLSTKLHKSVGNQPEIAGKWAIAHINTGQTCCSALFTSAWPEA